MPKPREEIIAAARAIARADSDVSFARESLKNASAEDDMIRKAQARVDSAVAAAFAIKLKITGACRSLAQSGSEFKPALSKGSAGITGITGLPEIDLNAWVAAAEAAEKSIDLALRAAVRAGHDLDAFSSQLASAQVVLAEEKIAAAAPVARAQRDALVARDALNEAIENLDG